MEMTDLIAESVKEISVMWDNKSSSTDTSTPLAKEQP